MRHSPTPRATGFALLEALIALVVAAFAIVGIVKLQGYISKSSAEAVARSEAATLMQDKLDFLRTKLVTRDVFFDEPTTQTCADITSTSSTDADRPDARATNAAYRLCWTLAAPVGASESRVASLNIGWTDSDGSAQTLALQSVLAWDDPLGQAISSVPPGGTMIAPVGAAKKGTKVYSPLPTTQISDAGNGLKYHTTSNNTVELIDAITGNVLLYLDPKDGQPQAFTTISGRVYFDQNGGNGVPDPADVKVRLSSEGYCAQDPTALTTISSGSNDYRYFGYTCYVGPGWYGNVGVTISDSANGGSSNATICVGDPGFNNGVSNSTLISAHSVESGTRSYRGFRAYASTYLSTGVAGGRTYPSDGAPLPSAYNYAGYGSGLGTNNYFNHNFLLARITGNESCKSKMTGGEFLRNAGKYYCINPHNDTANSPVCPSVWPGFESEVGQGGTLNYTIDVSTSGSGTVTSSPSGVGCPGNCTSSMASGTTVVLTATPASGQTFTGWGGSCSGSASTCTLTMDGAKVVTASFSNANTVGPLTITKPGTGAGTITSNDGSINCGSDCSETFGSMTTVILTATPTGSDTFAGWGGDCASAGSATTCQVSVDGAKSVTASFTAAVPASHALTVSTSGTGTVTSSPSGIDCGSTCSASYTSGTSVTLTAAAGSGSAFSSWDGACASAGTSTTCTVSVTAATSVTATFGQVCTTPISGTLTSGSHNAPTVTPSSAGSCTKGSGSNYSCSLSTVQGTVVSLTSIKTNGSGVVLDTKTLSVTASCAAQSNVNF